jgi:hypothetical protein
VAAKHGTTTKSAPADFGVWYELEAPEVARTLGVALGDRTLAEEATAEAFARAFSRWEQVRVMSSPVGWVYQVALNEARRGFRRRRLEERATRRRGVDRDVPDHASGADGSGAVTPPASGPHEPGAGGDHKGTTVTTATTAPPTSDHKPDGGSGQPFRAWVGDGKTVDIVIYSDWTEIGRYTITRSN